jgi:hypothetical protein
MLEEETSTCVLYGTLRAIDAADSVSAKHVPPLTELLDHDSELIRSQAVDLLARIAAKDPMVALPGLRGRHDEQ